MSIRYWLYAVALGGCLIGGLASDGKAVPDQFGALQPEARTDNKDTTPEDARPQANTPDASSGSTENSEDSTSVNKERCEEAKNDGPILDLCQQWRMANAAEAQVIATFEQNELTKTETTYLLISIGITVIATGAAIGAVWVTRVTAKRELRAYVTVEEATIGNVREGGRYNIRIKLTNFGQTPARDLRVAIGFRSYPTSGLDKFNFDIEPIEEGSRSVVGPSDHLIAKGTSKNALRREAFNDLMRGRQTMLVWGKVLYVDAFKRNRITTFRFKVANPTEFTKDRAELVAMSEGNDYT